MRAVLLFAAVLAAGVAPGARSAAAINVAAPAGDALAYVGDVPDLAGTTVVDARAQAACMKSSLRGAHCLPAADFLGPHGRLASFRQIYWLLGTAGLSGREHVLVVGDDPTERDFVAGMLYLCGQAGVSILKPRISDGAGLRRASIGPGVPRAMTRNPIYQAQLRGDDVVLGSELARELAARDGPPMLDGRSDAEYWGERIRAGRGGHLPNAQSMPMALARRDIDDRRLELPKDRRFVAYGHDAFESVAYFTLLRAGAGMNDRVLLDGWVDWANHPDLPVAAETWPERSLQVATPPLPWLSRWIGPLAVFNAAALMLLAGSLFYVSRPRK